MIIVISGMPGAGKTYLATKLIHDAWKEDPDRRVFTNFPVRWESHSSMKWDPSYTTENLQNSLIVVDEAYRDYNARKSLKQDGLDDADHLAFATNRHNENTFIFISQNLARLDTVIREISEIWWVSKLAIPSIKHFFEFDRWRPIWIKVEKYDCLDSFKAKMIMGNKAAYTKKRHLFSKKIAAMYDTHYWGNTIEKPFESEYWYKLEGGEKVGIITRIISFWSSIRDRIRIPNRIFIIGLFTSKIKTKRRYDVYESRGLVKEIAYKNWVLWRPVFKYFKLE